MPLKKKKHQRWNSKWHQFYTSVVPQEINESIAYLRADFENVRVIIAHTYEVLCNSSIHDQSTCQSL